MVGFERLLFDLVARSTTQLEGVLNAFLREASLRLPSDAGLSVFLLDPTECEPTLAAHSSWLQPPLRDAGPGMRISQISDPVLQAVTRSGDISIQKQETSSLSLRLAPGAHGVLWVPVLERKRVRAVIQAACRQANAYTERHARELASLAQSALPALDRALLQERLRRIEAPMGIVGVSASFLELERQVKDIGCFSEGSVLITGERGSGKELVAWAVHGWSRRRNHSFVPVLVSACADSLLSDELFGHEPHAFTGALHERAGKFKAAQGGTLFLDEAADLPATVQSALLRVLERGELQRLGRDEPLHVDVRVTAATSRDLTGLVGERMFRSDLLDRLSLFEVRVPPLRERPEDIPLLARQFLRAHCHAAWRSHAFARENACASCCVPGQVRCATPEFFSALTAYRWPGNIRELKHLMMRLVASVPDEVLDVRHLPTCFREAPARPASGSPVEAQGHLTLDSVIRMHIKEVLQLTGYNQSKAARLLGVPLSTLRSKMKRLERR